MKHALIIAALVGAYLLGLAANAATVSIGYVGDSGFNSLGDVISCALGFLFATRLPVGASVALFVGIEAGMLFVWRDSLVLNIIMLIAPIDAIRRWQTP